MKYNYRREPVSQGLRQAVNEKICRLIEYDEALDKGITKEDILYRSKILLDPEYLICTTDNTHKAIHYGDENLLIKNPIERRPNDTCPWRH